MAKRWHFNLETSGSGEEVKMSNFSVVFPVVYTQILKVISEK
jgi:hypothetical protein